MDELSWGAITLRILQQFLLEIKRVDTIFVTHKDNPPLTKNQPPIAGAIHWGTADLQQGP